MVEKSSFAVEEDVVITSQVGSVDFLTVTSMRQPWRDLISDEYRRLSEMAVSGGWVEREWGMKGYKGYCVAGVRWGKRDDGVILMLSGDAAAINWVNALRLADNVTRIDFAATITLADPLPHVAERAYAWLITDPTVCRERKRKYSLVQNSEGGETLYIGSRASDQFGRLYDKGREQGGLGLPPGTIWRYEVEFKSYRAKKMARQLENRAASAEEPVEKGIAECIFDWFRSRSITPIFRRDGDDEQEWVMELEAKVTDDSASLEWLTVQVRPTVQRLLSRDKADETLRALGIKVVSPEDGYVWSA